MLSAVTVTLCFPNTPSILKDYTHGDYFSRKQSIQKDYRQHFYVQSIKERLEELPFFLQYPEPPRAFLVETNTEPGPPGHPASWRCYREVRAASSWSIPAEISGSGSRKKRQTEQGEMVIWRQSRQCALFTTTVTKGIQELQPKFSCLQTQLSSTASSAQRTWYLGVREPSSEPPERGQHRAAPALTHI